MGALARRPYTASALGAMSWSSRTTRRCRSRFVTVWPRGLHAASAANGEDGFSLATARAPDVVILDVYAAPPQRSGRAPASCAQPATTCRSSCLTVLARTGADRCWGSSWGLIYASRSRSASWSRGAHRGRPSPQLPAGPGADRSVRLVTSGFRHHGGPREGRAPDRALRARVHASRLPCRAPLCRDHARTAARRRLNDTVPFTRTVDTHVAKLRKKIEDEPANPRHLITLHGYKFLGEAPFLQSTTARSRLPCRPSALPL